MSPYNLPSPLEDILANTDDLTVLFDRLMVGVVELLKCDRCYLYLRDPQLSVGQILHCHSVHPEIPNLKQAEKQTENFYLPQTDPLFAAALNCEATIFIENFPKVVNASKDRMFWAENFGEQKSLIQAHICSGDELWGIIQASQFNRPRPWTRFDRNLTAQLVDKITPLVSIYAKTQLRGTVQYLHDGYQ